MTDQSLHFTPGPHNSRAFRDTLGCFATGVCVVTAETGAGPLGMTVNSFSALSLDPPLVMWAPARASRRFDGMVSAPAFAIHVLAADQEQLARHFARSGTDFRFSGLERNGQGVLALPDVLARFDCTRDAVHDAGDHAIVVGRVQAAISRAGAPLVFSRGQMVTLAESADPHRRAARPTDFRPFPA